METYNVNICLVGDTNTGKSTFLNYLKTDSYITKLSPTIGVNFNSQLFSFDNYTIKWQIWDISGDDIFFSINSTYFRKITIFLLFFDLNSKISFDHLDNWIQRINYNSNSNHKVILIGNKSDLKQNITYEEIETFCKKYNLDYFEISIKNDKEIDYIVDYANDYLKNIVDKNKQNIDRFAIRLSTYNTISKKSNYEKNTNRICCISNCILS